MDIDDELKRLDPVSEMQDSGEFWQDFKKKVQPISQKTGLDNLDAEIEMNLQALDPIDKMEGCDSFWADFRRRIEDDRHPAVSTPGQQIFSAGWLKLAACGAIAAVSLWMLTQSSTENRTGRQQLVTDQGADVGIGVVRTVAESVPKTTIRPDFQYADVKEVNIYSTHGLMDMTDLKEGLALSSELEFEDIEVLVTTFRPELEYVVMKEINVYTPHGLMDIRNFNGDSGTGSEFELEM